MDAVFPFLNFNTWHKSNHVLYCVTLWMKVNFFFSLLRLSACFFLTTHVALAIKKSTSFHFVILWMKIFIHWKIISSWTVFLITVLTNYTWSSKYYSHRTRDQKVNQFPFRNSFIKIILFWWYWRDTWSKDHCSNLPYHEIISVGWIHFRLR